MAIFTAWGKVIYSAKYFYNARITGLVKFCPGKSFGHTVHIDGIKDLWCSSTVQLLSTQI